MQHVNPASGIPCPVAHPHGGAAARLAQHAQWPEADSSTHRLRTQPDLTAAWHPLRPAVQRRVEQNAVVRPPTAAHLGHPVFEHGHTRTDQPAENRLNQPGTEVKAADARHPVQRREQVSGIGHLLGLRHLLARGRLNGGILQRDRQPPQVHIVVGGALHNLHRLHRTAMGQHGQGVNAHRTRRLEPTVGAGGKRGTTGPRLNQGVATRGAVFSVEDMPVDRFRGLCEQGNCTGHAQKQRTAPAPKCPENHMSIEPGHGDAPRQGVWVHDERWGGETEIREGRSPGTAPADSSALIGLTPSTPDAAEGRVPRPFRRIGRQDRRIDRQGRHPRPLTERTGPVTSDPGLIRVEGKRRRGGRVVIGMVMGAPFVVRIPHHMMKGHVLQLQRMNRCPNEKQAPSGKLTEPCHERRN